jgi:hypothetical protein
MEVFIAIYGTNQEVQKYKVKNYAHLKFFNVPEWELFMQAYLYNVAQQIHTIKNNGKKKQLRI